MLAERKARERAQAELAAARQVQISMIAVFVLSGEMSAEEAMHMHVHNRAYMDASLIKHRDLCM